LEFIISETTDFGERKNETYVKYIRMEIYLKSRFVGFKIYFIPASRYSHLGVVY